MTYETSLELDRTDRILLGACAAIWLAALGAGVAAAVALVDLGSGHPETSDDSGTPWLLYTVIGVSAAVIVGAVPLLLRARRSALEDASLAPVRPAPARTLPTTAEAPVRGAEAQTEKIRVLGGMGEPDRDAPAVRPAGTPTFVQPHTVVDRLFLRGAAGIVCAMGVAMVAIGVATYLMAVDSNTAAWVLYVLAGLITLAMPAVPYYFLRELRAATD
jgi:Protein of unknown function (DUF2561)